MSPRLMRYLPSVILLALTAIFILTALQYSPGSRRVPLAVAVVTVILLAIDMAGQGGGRVGAMIRRTFGGANAVRPGQDGEKGELAKEVAAIGWIVGFAAIAVVLGFYIAIPVYVIGYLTLYARRPLVVAALIAAVLTAILYVLFAVFLGYEIFVGLAFGGFM